jgi:molybdopterin-guanine dinucleotide biosynthesis protein A
MSAAILAGGRAARFGGRDKSAIVVDGRTILERQIDAIRPLTDDILIVGAAAHPAARSIADRVVECGPLGGLDAALAAARDESVIVLACDMPFVTSDFLAHLVDVAAHECSAGAEPVLAVVPRTERGYHPLCAVYRRAAAGSVARRLAERRLKMTDLLATLRVRVVEAAEIERFGDRHRLLANVNTPSDLARHEL